MNNKAHRLLPWSATALLVLLATSPARAAPTPASPRVCFSPGGRCNVRLAAELDRARKRIDVAVYFLTDPLLRAALSRAKQRGVAVRLILDKACVQKAARYCPVPADLCTTVTRPRDATMHHKFALIDGRLLVTGSMNYTKSAATRNFENLLFLRNRRLIAAYAKEFERVWKRLGGTCRGQGGG